MLPRWWEWLVIALILTGLVAVLWPAVQNARNPKGPHGEMIPREPPVEANRVRHATGLSIVAPRNWDQEHDFGPEEPFLFIAARGVPGARHKALISVAQLSPPPKVEGLRELKFQGHPAWEQMRVQRHDTFDDPPWSIYEMNVSRNGQWWQITFGIVKSTTELPPEIRQYLETIEFPAAR